MSEFRPSKKPKHSAVVTVATAVTIDNFPEDAPHCFIGVRLMDANGVPKTASAGTFTITIKTVNNPDVAEGITDTSGVITATAPTTLGWQANTREVIVTPDSVAGDATHYMAIATANES